MMTFNREYMSSHRSLRSTALAVLLVATVLFGCGSEEEPSDNAQQDSSNQEANDNQDATSQCEQLEEPVRLEEIDSCERDDGCRTYGGPRLDAEAIVESDQSCGELYSEDMGSVQDDDGPYTYCIRQEWYRGSDANAPHLAARHDEDDGQWYAYVLPDRPYPLDKLGFVPCGEIPEEGNAAKEACLDCANEGVWHVIR